MWLRHRLGGARTSHRERLRYDCNDAPVQVTVLVPTYKRPDSLLSCLTALLDQQTPPDEVVVVARRDDASSRLLMARFTTERIRLVLVDVHAGEPGLVVALNAGLAASLGDIVCLTDDDAVAHPDWISQIIAAFRADPLLGAVGGRDWLYYDGKAEGGAAPLVGTMSWYGRRVGNHHLGVGAARDVAVLKGVNLAVRGDLLRAIGFDTRLQGRPTEHHWELGLCLRLLRQGYRVVYNPAIVVQHNVQPRVDEDRVFRPNQIRASAHNETLALLDHLSLPGRVTHLFLAAVLGTSSAPGVVRAGVSLIRPGGTSCLRYLGANLSGRRSAVIEYRRAHRARTHRTPAFTATGAEKRRPR